MTTLTEHIIVARAENRPPMLEKSMYDSWASCIHLFIKGKKHGRMMLDSIDNGPLKVQVNTKFLNALPPEWSKFVTDVKLAKNSSLFVPTFQQGKDPIDCINKAITFLFVVESRFPHSNNQLRTSSNPQNQATIQDGKVTVQQEKLMLVEAQEVGQILDEEQLAFIANPGIEEAPVAQQIIPQNLAFQTKDLDAYDSDCDDISSAKVVLMENLSSYDSDVLSEVPYSDTYPNDMINQDVQEMSYCEQTHIDDFLYS
ncbi:hypothetical protein Tco_0335191 [Tanacetum coccineum]